MALGTPKRISYTAAGSIVLPQGSTLGFLASEAGRFYVYEGTDGTNKDLGLARSSFVPEDALFSSTAISAAATSADVLYSVTARSNWVWRCVGYIEAMMGATLGNWSSIDKVQVMGPGVHRTGEIVQTRRIELGTAATGTTLLPCDDSIPQITEGDKYLEKKITPRSAINRLDIKVTLVVACNVPGGEVSTVALFKDAISNALKSAPGHSSKANDMVPVTFSHSTIAGTVSEITFQVRSGPATGGTTTINGYNSTQYLGGNMPSAMQIDEVFA